MSWVTIAITVGTAIIGAEQQHAVAKRQDNQLAAQIRNQQAAEQKVAARSQAFIQGQQNLTDQPQKTAAAKQYSDALQASKSMATQPLDAVGRVSEAYRKQAQDSALGVAAFGKNRGDTVASMDAPGLTRMRNQRAIGDFGIDVGQINRGSRSQDFLDNMKLNSIHANPYVSLLTSMANGYGRARLMGSAGGGGGASSGLDLDANQAAGGVDLRG